MRTHGRVLVRTETRQGGKIAFVTIDHRAKLNALGSKLMAEFVDAVAALAADEAIRALVVTGAGSRAFIAGADIEEMARLDSQSARHFISSVHRFCSALREFPAPVLARLNGFALGAGLELAASCDLRIAADTVKIGMPEVKIGMPSVVEAALLPMLVGWGRARELLLLGEMHSAQEAASWGLIERVVAESGLDDAVESIIGAIMTAAPLAVRLQKRLIRSWEAAWLADAVEAGIDSYVTAFASDEPARSIASFKASRKGKGP
jgi:enoyl-CoA hydratase